MPHVCGDKCEPRGFFVFFCFFIFLMSRFRRRRERSSEVRTGHYASFTFANLALATTGSVHRKRTVVPICCHLPSSREPGYCQFPKCDGTSPYRASFITGLVRKHSTHETWLPLPHVREVHYVTGHIGTVEASHEE